MSQEKEWLVFVCDGYEIRYIAPDDGQQGFALTTDRGAADVFTQDGANSMLGKWNDYWKDCPTGKASGVARLRT